VAFCVLCTVVSLVSSEESSVDIRLTRLVGVLQDFTNCSSSAATGRDGKAIDQSFSLGPI
jgi:hypothetical protein